MASQNDNDRQRAAAAITEALSADDRGAPAPVADRADPKQLFCENWDLVKRVLLALRQFAPAFLKPIIDMVIKAGDALQKVICR